MINHISPTSKGELRDELDKLIKSAYQNGVQVDNGGYECRHRSKEVPDWEVMIYRTKKPGDKRQLRGDSMNKSSEGGITNKVLTDSSGLLFQILC